MDVDFDIDVASKLLGIVLQTKDDTSLMPLNEAARGKLHKIVTAIAEAIEKERQEAEEQPIRAEQPEQAQPKPYAGRF